MAEVHVDSDRRKQVPTLLLKSTGFSKGGTIPIQYTKDGANVSPPLTWRTPPHGTVSLALVCEDPDAPSGAFVHWLLWGIPPDQRALREDVSASAEEFGLRQGENGFGDVGYGGPAPPPGSP